MSDANSEINEPVEGDAGFERTPEEMTGFSGGPPWLNRKLVVATICAVGIVLVVAGLVTSTINDANKRKQADASSGFAATAPRSFLLNELERANRAQQEGEPAVAVSPVEEPEGDQWGVPAATPVPVERQPVVQVEQYPQRAPAPSGREPQPQLSPLIPRLEGTLFSSPAPTAAQGPPEYGAYQAARPSSQPSAPDYSGLLSSLAAPESASEAAQNNKVEFYSGASGGAVSGYFLSDDALWIGTIIPAVLVTAINTDLPGNVIARTTQNIYDSRTGKNLLIPQGTLLMAQYNSSVSYAQRRVQIVWDILIRPDGFQVELEGMNGVDAQGMAGIRAAYRENWFEYVKAAGIITLFSVANAKLTEEVAQRGSDEMATAVVTANAEFVRDIGGNLISRAIDIQPTLTVSNGERISVMLNKHIFLPPVEGYQVTQKYTLP